MRLLYGGWGAGLLDGVRDLVCIGQGGGVYGFVLLYCIVQFRAMMLGVHVYVYIGYMVMDIH